MSTKRFQNYDDFVTYLDSVWDNLDGCRSCGWFGLRSEYVSGPWDMPDEEEYARGYMDLMCVSDDDEDRHLHRGLRVPLPKDEP